MNGVREEGKGGGSFRGKKTCMNVVMMRNVKSFFYIFLCGKKTRERRERWGLCVGMPGGFFFNWVRSLVTDVLFIYLL